MGFLKRLKKLFSTIIKVIAIVIAAAAALVIIVAIAVGLATLLSVLFPALVKAVSAIGLYVFGKVKDFISVFKPVIQSLRDLYNTWVKPTLTWVNDKVTALDTAINTIYTLTVGGVTAVYNNLFGWVDGIQTKFNQIVDNLTAIVGVVSQDAADRINALRDEINTTIDKYSSDLFDKVLLKINEVAGPILIRVGEITAVFTEKIDAIFAITSKLGMESDYLHGKDGFIVEDAEIDLYLAEGDYAWEEEEVVEPKEYVPPEEEPERSILDAFMENHVLNIMGAGDVIMAGAEKVIDEVVEQIVAEKRNFDYFISQSVSDLDPGDYYDDLILWLVGEASFGTFFRNHWKEVIFVPPGVEFERTQKVSDMLEKSRAKKEQQRALEIQRGVTRERY